MASEQIITGRKYRVLTDSINKIWTRISYWTKASDVEFDDGSNLEDKITTMETEVEDIKKSSSDGKSKIASAITLKGVSTQSDATFDTMANNIMTIGGAGIVPSGTKSITVNSAGTVTSDVTNYANVSVSTSGLVSPSGTKYITNNGTYYVGNYAYVTIEVAGGSAHTYTLTVIPSANVSYHSCTGKYIYTLSYNGVTASIVQVSGTRASGSWADSSSQNSTTSCSLSNPRIASASSSNVVVNIDVAWSNSSRTYGSGSGTGTAVLAVSTGTSPSVTVSSNGGGHSSGGGGGVSSATIDYVN